MSNLGENFYTKLVSISKDLSMKPEDLLLIMTLESGLNPNKPNKNGGAIGLNQFMPKTLKGLGFKGNPKDFGKLTGADQLDYVKRMVSGLIKYNGGPFSSPTIYYLANFIPAALKIPGVKAHDLSTVIVAKNPKVPHIPNVSIEKEIDFYKSNKGLDIDNDGFITLGDIDKRIQNGKKNSTYLNALNDMKNQTNYYPEKIPTTQKINFDVKPKDTNNIILNLLNKFLGKVANEQVNVLNKISKEHTKEYIVVVSSDNLNDNIECANILAEQLLNNLKVEGSIYVEENNAQVRLNYLNMPNSKKIISTLSAITKEAFNEAFNRNVNVELTDKFFPTKLLYKDSMNHHKKFINKLGNK